MSMQPTARPLTLLFISFALSCILPVAAARALDFQAGAFSGSWDTTLSFGQAQRVTERDPALIGTAEGGRARSPNNDDGDLNYDTGTFSRVLKGVTELSLKTENYGAFVRGSGLYDFAVMDKSTARTPLTKAAKDLVGSYTRLLDAFVFGKFHVGDKPLELRVGRQVVSWGESTFIQNGINTINHFDVAALRVPGSELREAFLPQQMVYASFKATENFSIDALYLLHWSRTLPEPAGSYFSANDYASDGGDKVFLGFGRYSDQGTDFRPLGGSLIPDFQAVHRLPDKYARNGGQGGLALRYYAPNFNAGTEFGLYFLKYHSRLPVISGRTGTQAGLGNAIGAATAVGAAAQGLAAGLSQNAAIATAAQVAVARSAQAGGNLSLATATEYATVGANTAPGGAAAVTAQAGAFATNEYAKSAGYFVEYPEDIKLIGLSFNTQLGTSGVALQGEVSYRHDVPLQYDAVELLFAALTPLDDTLSPIAPGRGALATYGQLGNFGLNQTVQGWGRFDAYQAQMTATKTFAAVLGASQAVILGEAGMTYISGLPEKTAGGPNGRGLRLNAPGTYISGNAPLAALHFGEVQTQDRFATAGSWGYRIAGRLEYDNAIGPVNLIPRVIWSHDVNGITPGPGGNFVKGRHGLTLGVSATLRATWEADFNYTRFGGGRYNELNDRDFIAMSVKYSF